MPTYKRPGVFVEESLLPLTQTISSPGDAVAAFVGKNSRGPLVPTLVNSWSQYVAQYGDFSTANAGDYLPFSVFEFFNNGGRACWVVRAAPSDAVAAKVTLNDRAGTPAPLIRLTAKSPGLWGNKLTVDISSSSNTGAGRFNIGVSLNGSTVEAWNDISLNPQDSRYVLGIINSPRSGSSLVTAADLRAGGTAYDAAVHLPTVAVATPLTTGADGVAAVDYVTTAKTLESVTESSIINLNLPGVNAAATINPILAWAEGRQTVFVVIDSPTADVTEELTVTAYTALLTGSSPFTTTSYAAVYGPWLLIDDPSVNYPGATRLVPPGGAVLGQYSQSDSARSVAKPPAGIATALRGVLDIEQRFTGASLDTLNQAGVNIIKPVPGYGFCVYGARTLKAGFPDRYISVRRVLMFLKKSILDGTQYAAFEPNSEELWANLEATISQFLMTAFQSGLLKGETPDQAFFVKCDEENNPPSSQQIGVVNVDVGVAVANPAEFVVIKIGQFDGGNNVTETTGTAGL